MTTTRHFVLAVAACLSGIILVGCSSPDRPSPTWLVHHDLLSQSAHAAVDLHALHQLQKGNTDGAIQTLERDLNGNKEEIEEFLIEKPELTGDTNIVRLVERILTYQTNHPAFWPTNVANRQLDSAWRPVH